MILRNNGNNRVVVVIKLMMINLVVSLSFLTFGITGYAGEPPFDRVFTSRVERVQIDNARRDGLRQGEFEPSALSAAAPPVKVSGLVLREDGKHMVWVDGKSELSRDEPSGNVEIDSPIVPLAQVPLRVDGKARTLRPGQVWVIESNEVKEPFEVLEKSINDL